MKTDELIDLLALGEGPVDTQAMARRLAIALIGGLLGAVMLMLALFDVRPDIREAVSTPMFWAKVAFPGVLALGALWLSSRLTRPGVKGGVAWVLLALPTLLVGSGVLVTLLDAPAAGRLGLVLGRTWKTCPFNIALLSVPAFVANFWALRDMAPTRPRLAGLAGGLLAGATATLAYCLHCPEMEVPFWGVWYLIGMLLPAWAGTVLGPRLLRW